MIGDQTEKRRHQQSSHVGAGHLDADHSLGFFRAEMARRGMDNGRIDRRASKSHQDQTGYRKPHPAGDQKKQDPNRQDPLAHPDQRGSEDDPGPGAVGAVKECDRLQHGSRDGVGDNGNAGRFWGERFCAPQPSGCRGETDNDL